MQGGAVGLYCAIGHRFDLRVSIRMTVPGGSQAAFDPGGDEAGRVGEVR